MNDQENRWDDHRSEAGDHDDPADPPWELADQFANLLGERNDLRGRTVAAVETRLRSSSVASTLVELLGVGITTTTELFGVAGSAEGIDEEVR